MITKGDGERARGWTRGSLTHKSTHNTQTLVCPESLPVAHGIASEREDAHLGTSFKTSFNPQNCPTSHRGLQNKPTVLPCQGKKKTKTNQVGHGMILQ